MELKGDSLRIVVLIGRVWSKEMICLQNRSWGEGVLRGRGVVQGRGSLALLKNPKKSYGTQSFYFVS
jgi:hypothetical protein